ncbi:hypothetical protein J2T15_003730 [Paenibacillus harenae]|uniref:Uncharacterized protein n=1 Tax=Paenibacillus harenae TaxID=306543 RepID=A0ABT9U3Q5_PAEHA|nr:hypothetical protein [Paenibacillus harenae]MDQ0114275.1 hypothetical protein [Paenibacillus harenae]
MQQLLYDLKQKLRLKLSLKQLIGYNLVHMGKQKLM